MHSNSKNYSQFQPEERVTLASLQQHYSTRAMARVLGRNSASVSAQHSCRQRRRSRPAARAKSS